MLQHSVQLSPCSSNREEHPSYVARITPTACMHVQSLTAAHMHVCCLQAHKSAILTSLHAWRPSLSNPKPHEVWAALRHEAAQDAVRQNRNAVPVSFFFDSNASNIFIYGLHNVLWQHAINVATWCKLRIAAMASHAFS